MHHTQYQGHQRTGRRAPPDAQAARLPYDEDEGYEEDNERQHDQPSALGEVAGGVLQCELVDAQDAAG